MYQIQGNVLIKTNTSSKYTFTKYTIHSLSDWWKCTVWWQGQLILSWIQQSWSQTEFSEMQLVAWQLVAWQLVAWQLVAWQLVALQLVAWQLVAWRWVSISRNSVVTTVTNAECWMPARGSGSWCPCSWNNSHKRSKCSAWQWWHGSRRPVPGIVQLQQSQTLEKQYEGWQFDAYFLE